MGSMSSIKIAIKIIFLCCLAFNFLYFYMVDEISDFIKKRQTITTRFEPTNVIEPPTITFCMNPAQKVSKAKAYGFTSFQSWEHLEVMNITLDERIKDISYVLNKDFTLKLYDQILKYGTNTIEKFRYSVEGINAWGQGFCHKIQPLFALNKVKLQKYIYSNSNF